VTTRNDMPSRRRLVGLWKPRPGEAAEDSTQRVFDAIRAAVRQDDDETPDEEGVPGCSPAAHD
jgi:hypothetical protein